MGTFWKKANLAKKNLIRRGAIVLVAYEAVWSATFWWVFKTKPADPILLTVAVLPTLTVAAFIGVLARYLREETDEFHRELVVRCLLWGAAAVMLVMTFHGFLQLFGWSGKWPVAIDLGSFFVAIFAAKLTYRVAHRPPVEVSDVL
jgi:Na+/proline symporter